MAGRGQKGFPSLANPVPRLAGTGRDFTPALCLIYQDDAQ